MANPIPPAVGIDLGTTFSAVAWLDPQGRPWTLPNSEGDPTTPSVVLFDGDTIVVGKEAVKAATLEPEKIADFAKRDMGNLVYSRAIGGERFPPEVIQSMILEKLKRDAETKIGPFTKCVITVPAFFNEPRRKATQDAGALAGLDVIDIINEPTAAAIAYGFQQGFLSPKGEARQAERVMVYDLGGGTFDVTLMEIEGTRYRTVATSGDVFLGGVDWDQAIVDYVAAEFQKKFRGADPRQHPASRQRLFREAEDAKRSLTAREKCTISFEHVGEGLRVPLTREQFEEMTAGLLERTRFTLRSVLKDAGMGWGDVTRLLLVGGSTRMPMVERMLTEESGRQPDRSLSPDESVAQGAALYAGLLLSSHGGAAPTMVVQNVNSHNLGVLGIEPDTGRPRNVVLIPRNTQLPSTKARRFRTAHADQRTVDVKIVEGGDASGQNSTPIGRCVVRDLPPGLAAGTPVEVLFTYAENGRLTVMARVPGSNREALLEVERESGLSDARRDEWNRKLRSGPLKLDG